MTDVKNEWVAEMPQIKGSSGVLWQCTDPVVQEIVTKCNAELAKVRAERDFWKSKHSEDNEGLMFQLGRNLEFAQGAVYRSGSTEVGPTIRCIQIIEEALTAARARIAELEKERTPRPIADAPREAWEWIFAWSLGDGMWVKVSWSEFDGRWSGESDSDGYVSWYLDEDLGAWLPLPAPLKVPR